MKRDSIDLLEVAQRKRRELRVRFEAIRRAVDALGKVNAIAQRNVTRTPTVGEIASLGETVAARLSAVYSVDKDAFESLLLRLEQLLCGCSVQMDRESFAAVQRR